MSVLLASLAPCFQGLLPSTLYTCSKDGVPNVAYLSHVDYVDPTHVALSFQFFNKSHRNISENPQAQVALLDPDTGQGWVLTLRYVRAETSGPVFDRMALRIEAIASYCGLKGIFKLLAADIYQVLRVEPSDDDGPALLPAGRPDCRSADALFTTRALQDLAARIHTADSLESLLDSILEGVESTFGFKHSMIALASEEPGVLTVMASRGYADGGAGSEIRFGEGIIGMVAEARKPIRIAGLLRGMLYAQAVYRRAQETGHREFDTRIPLPGLHNPESQLGVPLLVRGELIAVLCIESEAPYRFHEDDKAAIELLGSYLAIAVHHVQLLERSEALPAAAAKAEPAPLQPAPTASGSPARQVTYYAADECVLVDGEYLIRSLPARILWKLLSVHVSDGRTEFTNRELRLDKTLNLPEWKDNLETRLLLLRRRLEQKCPDIRLVPTGRGRFALQLGCALTLVERA